MATHRTGRAIMVTQADIDTAVRNNSTHCAVAEAVARELEVTRVLVDIQTIRYSDVRTDKRYIFLTPPSVQDYIIAFDAGEKIEPFNFVLPSAAYVGERRHHHSTGKENIEYRSRVRIPVSRDSEGKHTTSTHRTLPVERPPRTYTSTTARAYGIRGLRVNYDRSKEA